MAKEELKTLTIDVELNGREELHLTLKITADRTIEEATLRGVGGPRLLDRLRQLRSRLNGNLDALTIPKGRTTEDILIRELILKAQGRWQFPYTEDELCHCRVVPTAVVDQAICTGAHTPQKVSAMTSASTACGTCRPDVEAMIKYRLGDF